MIEPLLTPSLSIIDHKVIVLTSDHSKPRQGMSMSRDLQTTSTCQGDRCYYGHVDIKASIEWVPLGRASSRDSMRFKWFHTFKFMCSIHYIIDTWAIWYGTSCVVLKSETMMQNKLVDSHSKSSRQFAKEFLEGQGDLLELWPGYGMICVQIKRSLPNEQSQVPNDFGWDATFSFWVLKLSSELRWALIVPKDQYFFSVLSCFILADKRQQWRGHINLSMIS